MTACRSVHLLESEPLLGLEVAAFNAMKLLGGSRSGGGGNREDDGGGGTYFKCWAEGVVH